MVLSLIIALAKELLHNIFTPKLADVKVPGWIADVGSFNGSLYHHYKTGEAQCKFCCHCIYTHHHDKVPIICFAHVKFCLRCKFFLQDKSTHGCQSMLKFVSTIGNNTLKSETKL